MNTEYYRRLSLAPWPALRLAIILCGGIWLGYTSDSVSSTSWLIIVALLASCWFLLVKLRRKGFSENRIAAEQLSYILLLFFFGAFWYSFHLDRQQATHPETQLTYSNDSVTTWGTISRYRITESGGVSFELNVDSVRSPLGNTWHHRFKTSGFISLEDVNRPFIYGDYVGVTGTFDEITPPRNPHEFNFKQIMASRGIHVNLWIDDILSVREDTNILGWNYWRSQTRILLRQIFSEATEPLARAIILGDRSGLPRDDQQAFSRAGLAHLMAVSGMHVGFLLFPVWFIIPFLWDKRWKQIAGMVGVVLLLLIYAGITGFTVSVLRASVMALLLFYAKTFRKLGDSLNYLGAAALFVLLSSPGQLFEIGFQLSFTAVLVILMMLPVLRQSLPYKWRYNWIGGTYQMVMVSVIVQVGLYPILIYYFGEFSLIGPLSNTLAAIGVQIAFSWTLIMLLIAIMSPVLASFLNTPADYFFGFLHHNVLLVAEWDVAWITASLPSTLIFLIWAAAVFVLASATNPYLRWKAVNVFLALLCLYQIEKLVDHYQPAEMEITVLDVGQGDAILIQAPDGSTALYDTGIWSPFRNSGESVILPELQARGISRINALILSHPHADHIGGAEPILRTLEVDTVYDAGFMYDSNIYQRLLQTTEELDIPVRNPEIGDIIWIGESMPFFVLSPHDLLTGNDPNTYSIVGKLYYGDISMLLTGDATSQTERYMVRYFDRFLQSDVLKVAHHGSNTSSTEEFMNMAQPVYAVTSLGFRNRYRHPHSDAVHRLYESQAALHFTSLEGAVVFRSNGNTIRIHNWR